jgi:hypothetical protein
MGEAKLRENEMGIFVDQVPANGGAIDEVIEEALRADPQLAGDQTQVKKRAQAATKAAKATKPEFHWGRVAVGVLIGAVLILGGILLGIYADNRAIEEAMKVVQNSAYKPPELGIKGIATTVLGLGAAWSGGLVGVLLGEK